MSRRVAPIAPWHRSSAPTIGFELASLALHADGYLYPSSEVTSIKLRVDGDVLIPSDDTAAVAARMIMTARSGVVI